MEVGFRYKILMMLRTSLKNGDIVRVYTWFGFITMFVKTKHYKQVLETSAGDVEFPVEKLSFRSKDETSHSRWTYQGRVTTPGVEDIEYEEVEYEEVKQPNKQPIINLCRLNH